MAAPMSPLIFSLPVMYALVGFCSRAMSFWKVSSDVEIVTSASPPPSVTVTVPSWTSTFHWPAPSMSKTYELLIPAVLDESTREGRVSKKFCTPSAISSLPLAVAATVAQRARTGREERVDVRAVAGRRLPLVRGLYRGHR